MLEKIIEASVRNKFMVILAVLFLIGLGIYSMFKIPIDAIFTQRMRDNLRASLRIKSPIRLRRQW